MEKEPTIKVTDRRSFTEEGEPREGASGDAAPAEPTQTAGSEPRSEEPTAGEPPVDFNQLTISFYQQALHALGLLKSGQEASEGSSEDRVDLPTARYFIDLLSLLQDKTKNNLTPVEEKLLSDMLYELRMAFVHVSKGAPGQAK